ncbi:MAG: hypothetical protein PHU21_04955 [Elusimicrobia bacterium]|nr:hypothetical protein [Elusimicrobiota bacterium]
MRSLRLARPALVLFCALGSASAQAGKEDANNGRDLARPLSKVGWLYQYQRLGTPEYDDHLNTLEAQKPFILSPVWKLNLGLDLPIDANDAAGPGTFQGGLGDAQLFGLLVSKVNDTVYWGLGAAAIFPTASQTHLGDGKYRLAPGAGIRFGLPGHGEDDWLLLQASYDQDVAGDPDRSPVRVWHFKPNLNLTFCQDWFFDLYPSSDISYNAGDLQPGDTGRWFIPFDFLFGKVWQKTAAASLEISIPLVRDYDLYKFKLGTEVDFFF